MAETLCGPSNPLQNFQKHASVDRTLERDRLVSRQSPTEGFRSRRPNAGFLDAEFAAFVAEEPVAGPFHPQQQWPAYAPPPFRESVVQTQAPDWASDFQNLHLHDARAAPLPSAQLRREAPLQHGSHGPWQQEFLQQNLSQNPQHEQKRPGQGGTGFAIPANSIGLHGHEYSPSTIGQQSDNRVDESFDDEAFKNAFDAAHLELQDQKTNVQHHNGDGQTRPTAVSNRVEEEIGYRIGSDRILDESSKRQKMSDTQEADELAKTAGNLLENVKHDHSFKFQDSNFLSLMRQLRDKEVKVEGDSIVQIEQPLHPGGPGYPSNIEGLPAGEEVERPRPMASRIRASSVPRQRHNGSLAPPEHGRPPIAWSYDPSDHLDGFDFDSFLKEEENTSTPSIPFVDDQKM